MATDITGDIGPLYPIPNDRKYPMYSYETPAFLLWQGVYDGLCEGGMTHEQAIRWLQSKLSRWALDGTFGNDLRALGKSFGLEQRRTQGEKK